MAGDDSIPAVAGGDSVTAAVAWQQTWWRKHSSGNCGGDSVAAVAVAVAVASQQMWRKCSGGSNSGSMAASIATDAAEAQQR